ncbi:MAG: hypothetical protein CVT96_01860 [Bacteroidetes bacterium HGW-Bacteroidetes-13]|nr:MAG: hypothetical protein CVT96_01860 [Bacteroidetes bacterium HGW-Bacteroidetes-13]
MKKTNLIFWMCSIILIPSCQKNENAKHPYQSKSETALYHYQLGWQQIMDEGRYAAAERSYRKANYLDPDFLIGQSVYARLILDTDERIKIYNRVEAEKSRVEGDEQLLLDVYQSLVYFTNLREQKSPEAPNALKTALKTAEKNLGYLVSKYPNEIYLKSEYIEILHANYGAELALDSLESLTSDKQKQNPFLMGYAASMEAELGHFDKALDRANALAKFFKGISVPKPEVVYADVYFKKQALEKAYFHADKAYRLDSRNLDASRLRDKIKAEMQQRKDTATLSKKY